MIDFQRLSPNNEKALEDIVTAQVKARDDRGPGSFTPRMEAAQILKSIRRFLGKLEDEEREFTHCPDCGEPWGKGPTECESCAEVRSTAIAEHRAVEQETEPISDPEEEGKRRAVGALHRIDNLLDRDDRDLSKIQAVVKEGLGEEQSRG